MGTILFVIQFGCLCGSLVFGSGARLQKYGDNEDIKGIFHSWALVDAS